MRRLRDIRFRDSMPFHIDVTGEPGTFMPREGDDWLDVVPSPLDVKIQIYGGSVHLPECGGNLSLLVQALGDAVADRKVLLEKLKALMGAAQTSLVYLNDHEAGQQRLLKALGEACA